MQRFRGAAPVDPPVAVLSVTNTVEGDVIVNAESSQITIEVTSPEIYAGTYVADLTDLATGPVNLVPPAQSGTAAVGETLTITPGLWIYDADQAVPTTSYPAPAGVDMTDPSAPSYVVRESDADSTLTITERVAQDGVGAREAASNGIAIATAGGFDVADLFASGEKGGILIPGDANTIAYVEREAPFSTVCADTDPCGALVCQVTGLTAVAPGDNARPTYRTSGGLTWLEIRSGSPNKNLVVANGTGAGQIDMSGETALTVWLAMQAPSTSTDQNLFTFWVNAVTEGDLRTRIYSNGPGYSAVLRENGFNRLNNAAATFTADATEQLTTIVDYVANEFILRKNGTRIASYGSAIGGPFGNQALTIGNDRDYDFYGLVIRGAASAGTELTDTEGFLNSRLGA